MVPVFEPSNYWSCFSQSAHCASTFNANALLGQFVGLSQLYSFKNKTEIGSWSASRLWRLKNVKELELIFNIANLWPQNISQSILITYLKQKICFGPFSWKNHSFLGPDESRDQIGKSQEIWNWLVHPSQNGHWWGGQTAQISPNLRFFFIKRAHHRTLLDILSSHYMSWRDIKKVKKWVLRPQGINESDK